MHDHCPSCDSANVDCDTHDTTFEYGIPPKQVTIEAKNVPVWHCHDCAEEWVDTVGMAVQDAAVQAYLAPRVELRVALRHAKLPLTDDTAELIVSTVMSVVSGWIEKKEQDRGYAWTNTRAIDAARVVAEKRIHEAIEVYAGMDGVPAPHTDRERYLLRVLEQMTAELRGA